MNSFADLSDGQRIDVLVGFYDINRSTAISENSLPEHVVRLLKEVGQITATRSVSPLISARSSH